MIRFILEAFCCPLYLFLPREKILRLCVGDDSVYQSEDGNASAIVVKKELLMFVIFMMVEHLIVKVKRMETSALYGG